MKVKGTETALKNKTPLENLSCSQCIPQDVYTVWIYDNVSVTFFLKLLYFQEKITLTKHACLVLLILAGNRRIKNYNTLHVLSLHASFYVDPILKFSCLILLYVTIANPKVNSIKSVKWGEKFLKPPHMLPLRPTLPAACLWLSPTDVAFWEDIFVCQRRGAFQRFQRTELFHLSWSSAPCCYGSKLRKQKNHNQMVERDARV